MTQSYIEFATGRYPIAVSEIRSTWNGLFGDDPPEEVLDEMGLALVAPADPPIYDPSSQILVEDAPAKMNGKWIQVWKVEPKPAPAKDDVVAAIEAEKIRRIEAGFPFLGKVIQSRAEDRENIAGAKSMAQDAKQAGAQPGDYGWQKILNPEKGLDVFGFLTLDNSFLPIDVDQMMEMGYTALLHKQDHIFAGSVLKQRARSGEDLGDVTRDALWP